MCKQATSISLNKNKDENHKLHKLLNLKKKTI